MDDVNLMVWYDAAKVLPPKGNETQLAMFLVRYTYEDDNDFCFYDKASFWDGKFNFVKGCDICLSCNCHSTPNSEKMTLSEARVLHWAYIYHSDDHIEDDE